jgi:hypothetical protein
MTRRATVAQMESAEAQKKAAEAQVQGSKAAERAAVAAGRAAKAAEAILRSKARSICLFQHLASPSWLSLRSSSPFTRDKIQTGQCPRPASQSTASWPSWPSQDVAAGRFVQRVLQLSRAADGVSADDRRVLQRPSGGPLLEGSAVARQRRDRQTIRSSQRLPRPAQSFLVEFLHR